MQTNIETMTADALSEDKELVEKFYEQATEKIQESVISEEFVGRAPGITFDKAKFIASLAQFIRSFPDGRYVNEFTLAEGDRIVTVGTFSGTHMGEFQGIPPTGKKVSIMVVHVDRLSGGKIVEHLRISDTASALKQLQS